MAASVHFTCVKCNKNGVILLCNGCNQTFCFKHVNEHKQDIEKSLDEFINEQNQFENNLKNEEDSHPLFNQIDQWEKESIEQIKQIAKQAKQDLREILSQSNKKLIKDCQLIKENLHLLKQSEDLSEIQLIKLRNQFNQLKNQINSFQLIKSSNSNYLKIEKEQKDQFPPSIKDPSPPSNEKYSLYREETHSKSEGSILIREIDRYGYYIIVEHTGLTTDKQQDMIGWTLKRSIDNYQDIIYRFPIDFILKPKAFVKILSRQASETLYSYEKDNILIAHSIQTWGTGVRTIINHLIDANGDRKDIFTQILK